MTIPKSIAEYAELIEDIYQLPKDEEAKYDVMLRKGYSFDEDPKNNGRNGYMCSTWHTWVNVSEALRELRKVHKCDCAACMAAHDGRCKR